jgi:hypothetical protein
MAIPGDAEAAQQDQQQRVTFPFPSGFNINNNMGFSIIEGGEE